MKAEGEQKAAPQAEARELRANLEDAASLRAQLKAEGELRVAAETKLAESLASLEAQKKLLDDAKAQLL